MFSIKKQTTKTSEKSDHFATPKTNEKLKPFSSTSKILQCNNTKRSLDAMFCTPKTGFVDLVRDVKRKSLRRKKLWMNTDSDIVSENCDQNRNFGFPTPNMKSSCVTPKRFENQKRNDSLQLSSYKKLKSPIFTPFDDKNTKRSFNDSLSSPTEKENNNPKKIEKKQRRSSLFTPTSLRLSISRQSSTKSAIFGHGREIPIREGFLLKKSSTWKNVEWTSKYVALTRDGTLTYYSSYSAYLDEIGAKSIKLNTATVKNFNNEECEERISTNHKYFEIITLHQQRWIFACKDYNERDGWVTAIKTEIKTSLQGRDEGIISCILDPELGNDTCVDCGDPSPEWASVNIGVVMCIQCSGIHRNLGSHISQVRSLYLDILSLQQVAILKSVGNKKFNQEREVSTLQKFKPCPTDSVTIKQIFIVKKYKEFYKSA